MNGIFNPGGVAFTIANLFSELLPFPASQQTARTNLGIPGEGGFSMRNRLLNGDMRIDQANAGAVVSVNAAATFRSVDKWSAFGAAAAGVFSLQRLTATPPAGFSHYLRATVTTADAAPTAARYYTVLQSVEGTYCPDMQFGLAGNTEYIALSFWGRASIAGSYSGSVRNSANNRSYPFTFGIAIPNNWERVTVRIPADQLGVWLTTTGVGLILAFDLGCGSNNLGAAAAWQAGNYIGVTGSTRLISTLGATFDWTGAQVERDTATEFEQTPFPEMIRLCQREFFKTFSLETAPVQNAGGGTGEFYTYIIRAGVAPFNLGCLQLPGPMRAAPVVTFYNPQAANAQVRNTGSAADCSATTVVAATEKQVAFSFTSDAAVVVGALACVHLTADARL